jgi:hypothetical protein
MAIHFKTSGSFVEVNDTQVKFNESFSSVVSAKVRGTDTWPATGSSVVAFDAVTNGFVGNLNSTHSFAHTAAANAYVLLFVSYDRGASLVSATYDGTAFTLLGSQANSYGGMIYVYGISALTSGQKTISVTRSVAGHAYVTAVSYTGVASVGTVIKSAGASNSSTSGPVTPPLNGLVVNCLGHGQINIGVLQSNPIGGTNRFMGSGAQVTLQGASQNISDSSTPTTFSGTLSGSVPWGSITVPLNAV